MNPSNPQSGSSGNFGRPPGLAAAMSPMRARIEERPFGWALELSPIRSFDALRLWGQFAEEDNARALIFDVERVPPTYSTRTSGATTLAELAAQGGVPVVDAFTAEHLVLDAEHQRELVGMLDSTHLRSVLVDGPIERRDADAIVRAVREGMSPLEVELRAAASLEVIRDRLVKLEARTQEHVCAMVAENFRHYLAALRNRSPMDISPPQAWQIERLLGVSGTISVRAIETDVYSTSIDVGVSTATEPGSRPADRSLIYDVHSDTWHDEA